MTLHDRIREVVEERLRIARAANPSPWRRFTDRPHLDPNTIFGDGSPRGFDKLRNVCSLDYSWERDANAEHIVANDPSDVILSAEHALGMLIRHQPAVLRPDTRGGKWYDARTVCSTCSPPLSSLGDMWPCPEILALATRWRVEVDG